MIAHTHFTLRAAYAWSENDSWGKIGHIIRESLWPVVLSNPWFIVVYCQNKCVKIWKNNTSSPLCFASGEVMFSFCLVFFSFSRSFLSVLFSVSAWPTSKQPPTQFLGIDTRAHMHRLGVKNKKQCWFMGVISSCITLVVQGCRGQGLI